MSPTDRVRVVPAGEGWLVELTLDPQGQPICGRYHTSRLLALCEAEQARRALTKPVAQRHLRRLSA